MDAVIRGAAVYLFVLIVVRAAGKRALAEITTFDLALLLIVSETTQQALIGVNNSITNAFVLIVTMVGIDVAFSWVKQRSRWFDRVVDSVPVILVADGVPLPERLVKSRVDLGDVLAAARESHGLERLDQVKYAVLERQGTISIIPRDGVTG